jgi:hypothetical protein
VRDFLAGRQLPTRIGGQSLREWLASLARDSREFEHPDLAVALGVPAERPFVSEVAAALSFRLEESNAT